MSTNQRSDDKEVGAGSAGRAGGVKLPKLTSGSSFAAWQQDMGVFLAQNGCDSVHLMKMSVADWIKLESTARKWQVDQVADSLAALGITAGDNASASAGSPVKVDPDAPAMEAKQTAHRAIVRKLVQQSTWAYSALYSALEAPLRTQVSQGGDVPANFAYGLWMWLDNKFQSTEMDSVYLLLGQWAELRQTDDESWDAFRARVNHLFTLLSAAGEKPSERQRLFVLLYRLRDEYEIVVQAIGLSDKLKDPANVPWDKISATINAHERKLESAAGASAAAVFKNKHSAQHGQPAAKQGAPGRSNADRERKVGQGAATAGSADQRTCFVCDTQGHIAKNCPQRKAQHQQQSVSSSGLRRAPSGGQRSATVSMAKQGRFQALTDSDESDQEHGESDSGGVRFESVNMALCMPSQRS